jgi:uncharacterized protein (DUF2267 family)
MSVRTVDTIERNVQKSMEWLAELADELGTEDRETAWRVLRAYLQVLRDRLTIDEGAQLAAQLPHLLRGVFYEGFDPGHQPEKIRDREAFLARLAERAQLGDTAQAAQVAAAATRVLRRHVAAGEFNDILAQMPKEIRDVLVSS